MRLCKSQVAVLLALSFGVTGCQSPGSAWSWNPWANKDNSTALAKAGGKPALPSSTANQGSPASASLANSNSSASGAPINYPQTGTPIANFTQAPSTPYGPAQIVLGNTATTSSPTQSGGYDPNAYARSSGAVNPSSSPANSSLNSGGYNMPASYTSNGFGPYSQPASTAHQLSNPASQPASSVNPTAMMAPGSGVAPATYPQSNIAPASGSSGLQSYSAPAAAYPQTNDGAAMNWPTNNAAASGLAVSGSEPFSSTAQAGVQASGSNGSQATTANTPYTSQASQEASAANLTVPSSSLANPSNYAPGSTGYQVPNYAYGSRGLVPASGGVNSTAEYRPGGTSNYTSNGNSVVPANFELQPNVGTQAYATSGNYNQSMLHASGGPNSGASSIPPATNAHPPAGGNQIICENGICYPVPKNQALPNQAWPNSSQQTGSPPPASYTLPAAQGGLFPSQPAATATQPAGSLYR
jgi:hypothetical protein